MKKLSLILIFIFLFAAQAMATPGTCVVTDITSTEIASQNNRVADSETVIVTLTCTGGTDGSLSAATIPLSGYYPQAYHNAYNLTGYHLYQVKRIPGNNSATVTSCTATCPQGSYTTQITDADGFAVDLALLTTNGSATATQETLISSSTAGYPTISSDLTVAISANNVASAKITERFIFKVYKVY